MMAISEEMMAVGIGILQDILSKVNWKNIDELKIKSENNEVSGFLKFNDYKEKWMYRMFWQGKVLLIECSVNITRVTIVVEPAKKFEQWMVIRVVDGEVVKDTTIEDLLLEFIHIYKH